MAKIKKRPDGLYEIVRQVGAKRKHFYGKTIKEAEQKYLIALQREESGPLFSEIAAEWWEEFSDEAAPNSVHSYTSIYKRAVERFGDQYIREITHRDVSQWVKDLSAKGYAKKTVKNHLIIVSDIFNFAIREDELESNPASNAKLPKNLPQGKRSIPTEEDDANMMAAIGQHPFSLFPLLAKYTGARKGELLALQFKDISNGMVSITKSVYFSGNIPKIKLPKTEAGVRSVPLLKVVKDVLPKGNPNDYIFGGKEPLSASQFRKRYESLQKFAGFSATPHQWRHLYATILYDADINAKDAQVLLGHAQFSTTMDIYTHVQNQRMGLVADKLNSFTTEKKKNSSGA